MTLVAPSAPNVHSEQHIPYLMNEEPLSSNPLEYHNDGAILVIDNAPYLTYPNGNATGNGPQFYGGVSGINMGSYDGDIAWTLDFAQTHLSVEPHPNDMPVSLSSDFLGSTHVTAGAGQGDPIEDEDETDDWPDQVSRPDYPFRSALHRMHLNPEFRLRAIRGAESAKLDPRLGYTSICGFHSPYSGSTTLLGRSYAGRYKFEIINDGEMNDQIA